MTSFAFNSIKSNACGADSISLKFLKLIFPNFLIPILHIFNYSLEKVVFPWVWNEIKIKPIEKKSNPTSPADTRPITINSIFTKIITSCLNSQLKSFIENQKLLSPFQSGFRDKHSCNTALIRITKDINLSLAKNEITILVLLDIKSAYPSVSHELLLHVLTKSDMQPNSISWVKNFISNKKEFVEIADNKSDLLNVSCGLLQGDNLSQTFFALVINDVTEKIKYICRRSINIFPHKS